MAERWDRRVGDEDDVLTRAPAANEPFSALAFKIMSDPHLGKLTYIRVYSGHLEAGGKVVGVFSLTLHPDDGGNDRSYLEIEDVKRAANRKLTDEVLDWIDRHLGRRKAPGLGPADRPRPGLGHAGGVLRLPAAAGSPRKGRSSCQDRGH